MLPTGLEIVADEHGETDDVTRHGGGYVEGHFGGSSMKAVRATMARFGVGFMGILHS